MKKRRNRKVIRPVRQAQESQPESRRLRLDFWICILLFAITIAVYSPVRRFDFVNFDDPDYVSRNVHVREGFTPQGIGWAFTSTEAANWFPLTRLSHLLDAQLFGMQSGMHHLTNVFLHAFAVLLLFAFLERATHAPLRSAFVTFLFAVHPLHVESVAWVAERKDVLSAVFCFLSLLAYVWYTESPKPVRYLVSLAAFCLGLMSKPMLVTVPFLMLLLDFWPLKRPRTSKLVLEKIPFFIFSAASAAITCVVQQRAGAGEAIHVSAGLRTENALLSYAIYIEKMFIPTGLAVFYPFPSRLPVWQPLVAAVILAGTSIFVLSSIKRYPFLVFGWFWFLGTLVPVIGVVQVGAQARADRYMYLPMVGLSIMLVCGLGEIISHWPKAKRGVIGAAAAACALSVVLCYRQIRYWQNSELLFEHALAVTHKNYLAEHNLGEYLTEQPGRLPDAITHLKAAVHIRPDSLRARTDLGTALAKAPGGLPAAIEQYRAALRIAPDSAVTHNDLGAAFVQDGNFREAISELQEALRLDPEYAEAHNNLAFAQSSLANSLSDSPERLKEAISEYEAALRTEPDAPETHYNFGVALAKAGDTARALREFESALRLRPNYAEAHNNIGVLLANTPGRLPEAIAHWQAALSINPEYEDAWVNLRAAQLSQQKSKDR